VKLEAGWEVFRVRLCFTSTRQEGAENSARGGRDPRFFCCFVALLFKSGKHGIIRGFMSANPAARREKFFDPAIAAVIIAGACTFLLVYCTQPLLPYLQQVFHATEVEVAMTVGAVTMAVAITAPFTGMVAEPIGRKKVIVPSLFAMSVPTFLAATSHSLHALIFWRFAQGLFVPGVIAVMMAYINEEFPGRRGGVMAAYIAGTASGGFLGRFLTGIIASHWDWRMAFVVLGFIDLLGALAVRQWLPLAVNFVPSKHVFKSLADTWGHLNNFRLLSVCGMGFTILFSLVGVFTYANFYLAGPPFKLSPAGLGEIFAVFLLGCVVTPLAGRFFDRAGFRRTALLAFGMCLGGILLTLFHSLALVIVGLAIFSSGVFVAQAAATVLTGQVAGRARSAAAGLYVTFYYIGGSLGASLTAWFWLRGGWPGCVGLFAGVSAATLILGWLGATAVAGQKVTEETPLDTAI
jgi:MFS family permease